MSAHITGKLIAVGNYTEEEQVDRDSPLARAVVVMPREALKAVRLLPMYEDVLIVKAEEWDQLRAKNAALREDKARLDWLDVNPVDRMVKVEYHWVRNDDDATVRGAIDAARREAQP